MTASYIDVPVPMLDAQIEQLEYTEKWGASRGGNGSGKTTAWVWWTIGRMIDYPNANTVVIGASYQQLDQGFFSTLQDVLGTHFGLEPGNGYVYRKGVGGRPILTLWNGAKIHGWSAEQSMRTRSANVQTLILEEPQTWGPSGEKAWVSANSRLRPNERSKNEYPDLLPMGRISFNPTGVGPGHWLYEMLERRWPDEGWRVWRMSSRDNYLIGDPTYVHNLEVSMPKQNWPVEIEGHYQTSGGDVYRTFDDAVNCADPEDLGLPPMCLHAQKPIRWMLDFNVGFQCSVIAQKHVQAPVSEYRDGRLTSRMPVPAVQKTFHYVLGEITLERAGAEDVVKAFLAHPQWGPHAKLYGVVLYGDATGGAQSGLVSSASASTSMWLAIYNGLKAAGVRIGWRVQSRNPPVIDRINAVNAQFFTDGGTGGRSPGRNGIGAFFDRVAVPELLTDFRQVKTVIGKNEIDKTDTRTEAGKRRTHASDAYGYYVYVERTLELQGPNSIAFARMAR